MRKRSHVDFRFLLITATMHSLSRCVSGPDRDVDVSGRYIDDDHSRIEIGFLYG